MIIRQILSSILQIVEVLLLVGILHTDRIMTIQAFVTTTTAATTQIAIRTSSSSSSFSSSSTSTIGDNRQRVSPLKASLGTVVGSKDSTVALDWSFLDGVYLVHCPNGDIDGSRMKSTKETLSDVNLLDKLTVKEFDTDDDDRIRGCYTSHLTVYRDILKETSNSSQQNRRSMGFDFFSAFQKNVQKDQLKVNVNVLILEDNVALSGIPAKQAAIDSIASVVQNKKNKDWDVIHLCTYQIGCAMDFCGGC
jgi:hypothetical protein